MSEKEARGVDERGGGAKPCPFCGGDGVVENALVSWKAVLCGRAGCGAVGPARATEEEAIEAWNTRQVEGERQNADSQLGKVAMPFIGDVQ